MGFCLIWRYVGQTLVYWSEISLHKSQKREIVYWKNTDKQAGGLEVGFQMHMHSQHWTGEDRKSPGAGWLTSKAKLMTISSVKGLC